MVAEEEGMRTIEALFFEGIGGADADGVSSLMEAGIILNSADIAESPISNWISMYVPGNLLYVRQHIINTIFSDQRLVEGWMDFRCITGAHSWVND